MLGVLGNYQTEIDIVGLAAQLKRDLRDVDLDGGRRRGSPECLISKVKPHVRLVDEPQYTPQSVLVGAYHNRLLHWIELAKQAALCRALPGDELGLELKLNQCLQVIASLEDEARNYYGDGAVRMTAAEFVRMLLLDGWYILHIFDVGGGRSSGGETASQRGGAVDYIAAVRDVFYLLENQIPFFVLEKIHDLIHCTPPGGTDSEVDGGGNGASSSTVVIDGFMRHLRSLLQSQGYSKLELDITSIRPCHLVHLLHMHFRPACLPPAAAPADGGGSGNTTDAAAAAAPSRARATVYRWRGATLYHAAGVRFKRRPLDGGAGYGNARCVLDVELRRLTLHVPTLTVDNNTWRILRNLVALEQSNPRLGSHVTAYCLFMSQLAGTARDVELLARKGVVVHFLATDEDVADGFAKLCRGVTLDLDDSRRNYLQETWERMERRYSSRPVNWMALLRRRHLSNPLVAIALLAAIAGLVCEVLQAVYAINSYKKGL